MSSSDIHRITQELETAAAAEASDFDQAELAALLAAVTRLYVNQSTDAYGDTALRALGVTSTEACTVAAALLRSQSVTPFEFSIWFSGGRVGGER